MIQRQLKLRLTALQEQKLTAWLWHLTGVWNFAIRKIELDAKDHVYYTPEGFQNLLANHGKKLGIPSHVLRGTLSTAYMAWQRCFKKLAKKPRLKSHRNRLNSIPFPDPIKSPDGNYIKLPGLGRVRFHSQVLPDTQIKCGRVIKRASGWHLCLFIDATPNTIPITSNGQVGIDPGFTHLVALSTGEKVEHPQELQKSLKRLGQAQRGHDKTLAARLQERVANQRKDRNHKLSRRLVSENELIVFSKDNLNGLSRTFGKSVASAAIGQLRQMLSYKCRTGGREYIEVDSRNSTRICSACGKPSGPVGWAGLSVRNWVCKECGTSHDRDVNAAINTLRAGAGTALERKAANGQPFGSCRGFSPSRGSIVAPTLAGEEWPALATLCREGLHEVGKALQGGRR